MPARYGPLGGDEHHGALADILSRCFAFPAGDALPWVMKAGRENVRILVEGRRLVACLLTIPMGQYFGGRSVPTTGVAAVGVAPHLRGRGSAAALMIEMLREARAAGVPLSTLYPATLVLYRKVGYEQAGSRFEITIPASGMRLGTNGAAEEGTSELELRTTTDADSEQIVAAYRLGASRASGWLDRGPYVWDRVRSSRGDATFSYVAVADGRVEGYVYFQQRRTDGAHYTLRLMDLCANTPRAARRLLGLLSAHRSLATTITWYGAAVDPCATLLEENTATVRLDNPWMLRIVDVKKALSARGYPKGLEAELHLEVADDVLPENGGRFVLTVGGGRGRVRAGGNGRIALHVRGLAALYSGHLSAAALRVLGALRGDDRSVAAAGAVFAGPAPSMPDMF